MNKASKLKTLKKFANITFKQLEAIKQMEKMRNSLGISVQIYDNEIWVPTSTRTINKLQKNDQVIVKLNKNRQDIFHGIGKIISIKNDKINLELTQLPKKDNTDSFSFIFNYEPCNKGCKVELIKKQELEPALPIQERYSEIEKKLWETILSLTDEENKIQKLLKTETNKEELKTMEQKIQTINSTRQIKQKTLKKAREERVHKEKTETDLFTILFSYDDMNAIVWHKN